jgi:type IX secretion system PorP/SprF family membrane protein
LCGVSNILPDRDKKIALTMRKLLLLLGLLNTAMAAAQDPLFSQFYAAPLQINPGFAGSSFAPRMGAAYRNQWTGFDNAYRTYALYYEQSIDRLNSGIGFNIEGDDAGNGILKTLQASAIYAYRLQVSDQFALKIGAGAGARQSSLDWDKLLFPDQINPKDGPIGISEELRPDITNRTSLDISAGLLALGNTWHLGIGLKHLNSPDESILLRGQNLTPGLPILYIFHGGAELFVKEGNKRRPSSFLSPNFLFATQGPFKQLNVGAYGAIGSVFGGAWYRHTFNNSDAAILLAGFRKGVFKIGLSYDLTLSTLARRSGGTFELTVGMLFDQDERIRARKRKPDINNCLKMFQ